MLAKTTLLSLAFIGGAFSAPAISERTDLKSRAEWQDGKCQAHIHIDASNSAASAAASTHKWAVDIINHQGAQIGHWAATNPAGTIKIPLKTEFELWIGGRERFGNSHDALTLGYNTQRWNSKDCFKYTFKAAGISNGSRDEHEWYCQFDC
ncbi:hypothetical protein JX266_000862 [Neoarthrinium moseri]|nr:hypothetical protein JX266_000862 [Neoarthrinium moseri]